MSFFVSVFFYSLSSFSFSLPSLFKTHSQLPLTNLQNSYAAASVLRDRIKGVEERLAAAAGAAALRAERAGAPRGALTKADASHYVSVAAVGAIGVGALRAFMRACRKALSSAAAGSSKGSSWKSSSGPSSSSSSISASAPLAAALALSEVLGLYALSTTLLTSRRLPLEASAAVDSALGGHLDAGPFHRAFNATFLLAAAATVAVDAVRRALADSPPPPGVVGMR